MSFTKMMAAAGLGLALSAGGLSAATFNAYSNLNDGTFTSDPDAHVSGHTHSVWFSGSGNPSGTSGPHGNHFLFEWGSVGHGLFSTSGTSATLTGEVVNAAGQGFLLQMYLVETADPGAYKNPFGADTNLWTFYDLDPNNQSMLTALPGSPFADFDLSLRGAINGNPLKVQFGVGANDKDNILGLSSWVTFTERNCLSNCASYAGDINIRLEAVPLPAGLILLPGAFALLGALRARRRN